MGLLHLYHYVLHGLLALFMAMDCDLNFLAYTSLSVHIYSLRHTLLFLFIYIVVKNVFGSHVEIWAF